MKIKCENCNAEIDTEKKNVSALIFSQDKTEYCGIGVYCDVNCMEAAYRRHVIYLKTKMQLHVKKYKQISLVQLLKEIDRLWHTKFNKFR